MSGTVKLNELPCAAQHPSEQLGCFLTSALMNAAEKLQPGVKIELVGKANFEDRT